MAQLDYDVVKNLNDHLRKEGGMKTKGIIVCMGLLVLASWVLPIPYVCFAADKDQHRVMRAKDHENKDKDNKDKDNKHKDKDNKDKQKKDRNKYPSASK